MYSYKNRYRWIAGPVSTAFVFLFLSGSLLGQSDKVQPEKDQDTRAESQKVDPAKWVAGLGSKKFHIRQSSGENLKKYGGQAISEVARACFSKNSEIAFRSRKLVYDIAMDLGIGQPKKMHLLMKAMVVAGVNELIPAAEQFERKVAQNRLKKEFEKLRTLGASVSNAGQIRNRGFGNQPAFGFGRVRIINGPDFQQLDNGPILEDEDRANKKKNDKDADDQGKDQEDSQKELREYFSAKNRDLWVKEILQSTVPFDAKKLAFVNQRFSVISNSYYSRSSERRRQRFKMNRNTVISSSGRIVRLKNRQLIEMKIGKGFRGTHADIERLAELPVLIDLHLDQVKVDKSFVKVVTKLLENEKMLSIHWDKCRYQESVMQHVLDLRKKNTKVSWNFTARALLGVLGLANDTNSRPGAILTDISAGSGADEAGLQKDDIIVKAGKFDVLSFEHLRVIIAGKNPGDVVEIVYKRGGKKMTAKVRLSGSQLD